MKPDHDSATIGLYWAKDLLNSDESVCYRMRRGPFP